uniref:Uncharacterized protein n=1 Tax=Arion vulgaris TaxID=1028688 RepID=A0A0B7A402_9EUPU
MTISKHIHLFSIEIQWALPFDGVKFAIHEWVKAAFYYNGKKLYKHQRSK